MISGAANFSGRLAVVAFATVALLLLGFANASQGSLPGHRLLAAQVEAGHLHQHGNHYHDDDGMMVAADTDPVPDHHHADHSHDKGGVLPSAVLLSRHLVGQPSPVSAGRLSGEFPTGIDRPPRKSALPA